MKRRLILLMLVGLTLAALAACQTDASEPTPIYVTEVFILDDGREVVLTLEATATPEVAVPTPEPTIPIPESVVQLDMATTQGVGELDPQIAHNDLTATLIDNLYAGLTRVDAASNVIVGELAQGWEVQEDGRVWTFELREDVYWVQGLAPRGTVAQLGNVETESLVGVDQIRPISADDVVAGVRRTCDSTVPTPNTFVFFIIDGCERLFRADAPSEEDWTTLGVRAVSDTRVEVRLTQPASYFLSITSLPGFRPIPADRIEDDELDWLDPEDFVSSGPFLYSRLSDVEAEPLPITVLQSNPFWPEPLTPARSNDSFQAIERINLYRYGSLDAATVDYDKDLLDIAEPLASTIAQLVEGPVKPPPIVTQGEVFYLGFNFDSPAFGLPEVRRAFSAAIDREALLEAVYGNEGLAMRHLAPPSALLAPPINEVGTSYNPDYAFFQLLNSGFGSCRAIGPISYLINATDNALRHAEVLIQMWVDELGCEATQFEIEQVQFGTLLARTNSAAGSQRPDLFDLGWVSFYPDAHNWYADVMHCERGENRPKRPCSEIDAMIDQAAATLDSSTRAALYRDIENGLFNQDGWSPIVPLYVRGTYQLEQDWVTRFGDELRGEDALVVRHGPLRFDLWGINQDLKELERSQ